MEERREGGDEQGGLTTVGDAERDAVRRVDAGRPRRMRAARAKYSSGIRTSRLGSPGALK
jgi:hypothetical protein